MKKTKLICLLLTAILLMTGVCGCMNLNFSERQAKLEEMKSYAENKYNMNFDVVDFTFAKDETYRNILRLTDGKIDFYVYNSANRKNSDKIYDDYSRAIISDRVVDFIKSKFNTSSYNIDVYAGILIYGDKSLSYDYAVNTDADDLLKSNKIFDAAIIVKTDKKITEIKDLIFEIYNLICSYSPEHINLKAIQSTETNEVLDNTLKCIIGNYNDDWLSYKGVTAYLETDKSDIDSADEFVNEIKYN